jgi:hypothetical protein
VLKDFTSLATNISQRLSAHHYLYPAIKAKDVYWEFILAQSIAERFPHHQPVLDVYSQQIGKDIDLSNGVRISCKSGQVLSGHIKISSYRMSRVFDEGGREGIKANLAAKDTDDYIACLSTRQAKKGQPFDPSVGYIYSVFDSKLIDYEAMAWRTFGKHDNLEGRLPNGIRVTSTQAMGWQIWCYIPPKLALFSTEIKITPMLAPITVLPMAARHGHLSNPDEDIAGRATSQAGSICRPLQLLPSAAAATG